MTTNTGTILDLLLTRSVLDSVQSLRELDDPEKTLLEMGDEIERQMFVEVSNAMKSARKLVEVSDAIRIATARSRSRRALAQTLSYAGRFEDALEYCGEAIAIADEAEAHVHAARARLASIHPLGEYGRYSEAIHAGEVAQDMLVKASEPALAGRADFNLGVVHRKAGNPDRALMHFARAAEALQDEPPLLAQLQSNRGEVLLEQNDLGGSEVAFLDALDRFGSLEQTWACAIVEGNLGDLDGRRGRFASALRHFESARGYLETDSSPTHLARIRVELGDAKLDLGLIEEAALDYEAAVTVLEEHGQSADIARALTGLARIHMKSGAARRAEEIMVRAIEIWDDLGNVVAKTRLELCQAELLLDQSKHDEARSLLLDALPRLVDREIDQAGACLLLARSGMDQCKWSDAESWSVRALAIANEFGIAPLKADVLHFRGRLALAQGDHGEAINLLRSGVAALEIIRSSLQATRFRAAFLGGRVAVYRDLVAALIEAGTPDSIAEAFEVAEQAKNRTFLETMLGTIDDVDESVSDHPAAQDFSRVQEELNALYSRLDDEAPPTRDEILRIRDLEQEMHTCESRLLSSGNAPAFLPRTITAAEIAAILSDNEALIEFFEIGSGMLAFVVTIDGVAVHSLSATAEDIQAAVQRFHFQIGRALEPESISGERGDRLLQGVQKAGYRMYEMTLARCVAHSKCSRLIVVPHGPLHTIPFAALWMGDAYVVEQFEIVHAPSAAVFLHGAQRRGAIDHDCTPVVVGVADERAPLIEKEAKELADIIENARLLIGQDATKTAVYAAAKNASIIHMACHGRFLSQSPLASGLRLSDGWVTVQDLVHMKTSHSLVVLSACESGLGDVSSGDEVVGLVRSILEGGAAAVIVSFWLINDQESHSFMLEFWKCMYNRDKIKGCSTIGEALRSTQLHMLQREPHPAFWAPFILVGAPS